MKIDKQMSHLAFNKFYLAGIAALFLAHGAWAVDGVNLASSENDKPRTSSISAKPSDQTEGTADFLRFWGRRDASDKFYDWTGVYMGLNLGVMWSNANVSAQNAYLVSDPCKNKANSTAFNPGWQGGALQQFDNRIVVGGELDFTYAGAQGSGICDCDTRRADSFTVKNQMQGSIRGRLGYSLEDYKLLPFVTAGVSFASAGLSYRNEAGDYYSKSSSPVGWVVGGGVEYGVNKDMTLRAEYLYTDYGNSAVTMPLQQIGYGSDPSGSASTSLNASVLRTALNYRF